MTENWKPIGEVVAELMKKLSSDDNSVPRIATEKPADRFISEAASHVSKNMEF